MCKLMLASVFIYCSNNMNGNGAGSDIHNNVRTDSAGSALPPASAQIYITEGTVIHNPENLKNAQTVIIPRHQEQRISLTKKAKNIRKKKTVSDNSSKSGQPHTAVQHCKLNCYSGDTSDDVHFKTFIGKNTVPVRTHDQDFAELPLIKKTNTEQWPVSFCGISSWHIIPPKQFLSCIKIRSPGLT